MRTKKLALSAILLALALALSYAERFLPLELVIPLPGVKLGLANVVTLYAIYALDPLSALAILILRCIMSTFFGGSVTSLAFSLAGGALAFSVMLGAKKISALSEIGVSVIGAAGHNIGQIIAAAVLMRSMGVAAYLPVMLVAGVFTGVAIGFAVQRLLRIKV
ncbi:MAG: Gx transporter family protein [Oscillospiraceae bacterium]|nr:Gx transporter family protein [Oscillospiraceae bacterium]